MGGFLKRISIPWISSCEGGCPAAEGVRRYHAAGYDGIVVTDHYTEGFFGDMPADTSWRDKLDRYLTGWRAAMWDAGGVLHDRPAAWSCVFAGSNNDYLVYGATPALLEAHPALYTLSSEVFSRFAKENGLWWAQAHPFRPGLTRCPPSCLDGLEVFNGNPRHDSHNGLAAAYAEEHGLTAIAGSDYHELPDLSGTGVRFHSEVTDNRTLLEGLRSGAFDIVRGPCRRFGEKVVDKPAPDRYNILRDTRGGLCFCNSSPCSWAKRNPCPCIASWICRSS